jgi:hypothetical protein
MYRATRELIKIRQPHSIAVLEKLTVNRIVGGSPRQCYDNACLLNDNDPSLKIVSGWYVTRWDKLSKSCLILAHYWNIDSNGNYIDCSPMDDVEGEYVVDSEIGIFASINYDKLHSSICSSLLLSNNGISGVDFREHGKVYREFKSFRTEDLFSEYIAD